MAYPEIYNWRQLELCYDGKTTNRVRAVAARDNWECGDSGTAMVLWRLGQAVMAMLCLANTQHNTEPLCLESRLGVSATWP